MYRPPRHYHPRGGAPAGGGGGAYPQPNNFPQNPSFNPQFYQHPPPPPQQQQAQLFFQNPNLLNPFLQIPSPIPLFQNPGYQNPVGHHPNISSNPPAQNPSLQNPKVTIERVESAVAKAQRDLVTAGENVSAWKVSQAALVSLQVDSWSSLGFQIQDVPALRRLLVTEGKVNAFIHCFVGAQKITSLYDLEVAICKNEGIESFEELGLGPLSRHPLAQHYFLIPSDSVEILKISSEDIITSLQSFMIKHDRKMVSAEEFLDFFAKQKSVSSKGKLGVRIQSLGLHISYIREAKKAEKAILSKSLGNTKSNKEGQDLTGPPSSKHKGLEKQMLDKRFDSITGRVKLFSSLCNEFGGKHTRFDNDGHNDSEENEEDDDDHMGSGSCQSTSQDKASSQNLSRCPYPSTNEEMIRLGLKSVTSEKVNSKKDKSMGIEGHFGKKRKRKRGQNNDATMKKFLRKDEVIKVGESVSLSASNMEKFITTWKEACREHSAAEVLDLMINFYMASITEKKKEKIRKIFSSYPGSGLLNVAVTSIKRGLLDSVYDTVQAFGDNGSAPVEILDIGPSVKEDLISNTDEVSNDHGYRVTVDEIIKSVTNFFSHDVLMSSDKELPSGKLFETFKKLRDCETWLATQFSVKDFSSLGHGNFFSFLERHACTLSNDLVTSVVGKLPEQSSVQVTMLDRQLGLLLSQAQNNLIDSCNISKSDISLLLKKQFPTISFHFVGNEQEKCNLNLLKRHNEHDNSSCVLYSVSLLGKRLTGDHLSYCEKLKQDGEHIYSRGNVTTKDAIECLLKVPMLSDLLTWSHWDILYAPSFGPLSNWLLNEVDAKGLLCVATMDGKYIRVDNSATADDFLEAMIQGSPFQVALKLLSLLSLYGGAGNVPISLLKCYAQRAFDVILKNSTDSVEQRTNSKILMHKNAGKEQFTLGKVTNVGVHSFVPQGSFDRISRAVINVGRFILDCLKYLPSEFKSFGSEILVSGLRYITKDAYSVILRECNQTDERFMLHDIGLSLGIMEWVEDFYEFSSTVATDLFTVSMTLHRNSLCTGSRGTLNLSRDISGNPISIDHNISDTVVVDASNLDENFKVHGGKFGENGAALPDGSSESQDFSDTVSENCEIAENRIIQDATAIVESIRREEFGLDPNLDYTETCMLKKQHARLGRALHCLSQELYSQDSHLLLELVQNADDNIYSEDVDPTLIFILQETGIIVLNNEQGFSAQNIRALCDIGNSTKKGSSAGYIGHKGIGFKSVFRVTDAPEIHSNGFHVKFDITEGQIGFVLPTVIPPCNIDRFRLQLSGESYSSDTNQWNTCIVLPFRSKSREGSGMASIISMFSDLHPSLLLFLHRLRSLKFLNILNNTLVNMRREILGDGIVKVSHGQETMTWLVINKKLPANFIRSDVQSTEIAIAFTLEQCENDEYKPHLSQQPVFAFLPLRNYGLKFILQGDFVLPSSREEVDGDSAWNQWLLSEFPALFVSAEQSFCDLPCFQNYLGKAVTLYLSFVPLGGEVHGFFSPLPHMIISKLRTSNCLLLDGPDLKWVPPCRVLRGWNGQIRMLLSDSLIQKHLGLGYLSKDIELSDVLAKSLGVQEYGPKILIEVISSVCRSSDDMNSLGLDWLSSWLVVLHSSLSSHSSEYPFVDARLEYDLIDSLKKIPFIPLSDGSYTSLADGPIWLPYDASSNGIEGKHSAKDFPSLYANLRTVNPLLLSAAAKNRYSIEEVRKDNLVHMLFKIGVQQLSAHEIMKSHILVALSKATYSDEDRYLMIEYLAFILLHFQSDCGRCSSEKNDIMSELRKKPLLLTNHGFKCPTDEPVHFGKEYQNPVNIDKLVDNVDDKWLEVDVAYLKHSSTRSLSSGLTKWKGFLQELGVTNFVQVISINRSAVDIPFSSFKDMTPYGDINLATSVINDWESPELLNFLSTFSSKKCREKCIYLLEVLDKMWDDLYNAYSRCCITSETNEGKKTLKSSFVKVLNAFGWIASSVDQDLHKPEDMFYDCDEVRSILGNLAPYVVPQVTSKMLLKDIGFKTEVSLADALEILQFWKTSKVPFTSSIHQMSKFYTFISNELNRPDVRMNEEFTSSSFIFVPFFSTFRHNDIVSGIFLSPKELYWHDPTGCVDKIKELLCLRSSVTGNNPLPCKALATIYPGLFDFFANVCAVPKSPPFESYLQILLQLSSVALPSQAAHVVFRVFVKWADDVKSGLINPQKILNLKEHLQISENTVLPTSQDKWVSLHPSFGLICWPDDNELKQQFKHSDGISFLEFGDLSNEDQEILCGKVAPLMHDIGVPALSEVVYREAVFYGTDNNAEKAALINWVLPFAQRYVHKLYPDLYLNLKKLQFDKLNQLQVIVVEKLFYRNHLKGQGSMSKRRFECSCLLQGNILYATRSADPHSLFLEFSRLFFNGSTELHFANFLHMITTMAESGSTSEQTEFFIVNSQKVPLLPLEEPLWCLPSLMEPPKLENPQPAVTPANTIDQNTPTSQRRPGANPNWPPTGWKSAPDVSYAQANYHLTKPLNPPCTSSKAEPGNTGLDVPHTEDLPIPVEIDGKWIVGDGTTASATVANLEVNSNPEPDNQLDDAISNLNPEKERQFYRMPDEKQAQKTGRLGELVAYKYFVEKYGSGNVKWVNEEIETGLPYDLILGPEGSSREYIEVKATRYSSKDWFEISPREWQFAVEWGDSYSIAHVLLGAKKASIIVLKNPLRLCQQNALQLALWISRQLKDSQVPS